MSTARQGRARGAELRPVCFWGIVAIAASSAHAQPKFEILPSRMMGAGWDIARAVSGDGQIVVGSGSDFSAETPSVWRRVEGTWTRFDLPVVAAAGRVITASDSGDTVVGMTSALAPAFAYGTPTRWTGVLSGAPVMDSPLDVPGSPRYWGIFGGLSDDGHRTTGALTPLPAGSNPSQLWLYQDQPPSRVSPFPDPLDYTGALIYGNAMSGDGRVIVGSRYRESFPRRRTAFRWTEETGFVDLPAPATGFTHSRAEVISRDGAVIGGVLTSIGISFNEGGVPVLWTSAGRADLPLWPGAGAFGRVMALSGDGSIACGAQHQGTFTVQSAASQFPNATAVVWLQGQVHELRTYLADRGVDLQGVEPGWASGISKDGRIIVGCGRRPIEGDVVPFVVTLPELCSADLTGDGVVDFADYLEFLNLFEAMDPRVDFNQDGVVDFGDYLEFLNFYDAGC